MSDDPIDIMARTLWGEARGCGVAGMRHVANVIVNRADHPSWWGRSITTVCRQPWQFSCWNPDDPNLPKLLAVTAEADSAFRLAIGIAHAAVTRQLPDMTYGADSYYALGMKHPPYWAAKAVRTMVDGCHAFYRTVAPAPPGTHPDVRTVSSHAPAAIATPESLAEFMARDRIADDLNAAELQRLHQEQTR